MSDPTPDEVPAYYATEDDGSQVQVAEFAILITPTDPRRSRTPGAQTVVFAFQNGPIPDIAVAPLHDPTPPNTLPAPFDTANFGPYAVEAIRTLTEGPHGSHHPHKVEIVRWNQAHNRYERFPASTPS